jgi:uncharacterized protein
VPLSNCETAKTFASVSTLLNLNVIPGSFVVVQLSAQAEVPAWAYGPGFFTVTRTAEELSVLCLADRVPEEQAGERGWACLQLVGPFEFTLTGILLSVLEPLAQAGVGIFAISTFNTDYVLVKDHQLATAVDALRGAGHIVDSV